MKNTPIYLISIIVSFVYFNTSCKGQNHEDDPMKKHTKVIKDYYAAPLLEPSDDNLFCKSLRNIKIAPNVTFTDEESGAITYFIQIFFSVKDSSKITFLRDRNRGSEQYKEMIREIENVLKKIIWRKNQVSSIYVFSCKITSAGLIDIYLSTEDNYIRKPYCQ